MEKYGFVYIWYDKKRKMYYVGSHWGFENDGYICSSNRMRDAYRRRPGDFKRRIICKITTNRKDLLLEEFKWLDQIKSEELGKRYYNLRKIHSGHWSTDERNKLTVRQKISMTTKGKPKPNVSKALMGRKLSVEHIKKLTEYRPTEDIKRKISQSLIGRKRKPFSDDHIKNLRLSKIGRSWYNYNGKTYLIYPNEAPPRYLKGRNS